jgi:dipeptidase E
VRLYLSSFRNGDSPENLLRLLGEGRRTALICNACDFLPPDQRTAWLAGETGRLQQIGLSPVEVDLRDYFGAPGELETTLSGHDLIWVRGGNVFLLRRALRQSGADEVILSLLRRDAVTYGGYSAGICVLSPSLRGLELVDGPNIVPAGYDEAVVWDGLNLVSTAFAPHYRSPEHPESAAIDKLVAHYIDNHVPFIALRDGEAVVVDGDTRQVVGCAR